MNTRAIKAIGALTAVLILIVSCYWQADTQTGTFSFRVPANAGARSGERTIDSRSDALRVYLMADEALVRFGPPAHPYWDEIPLAINSVSATYTSPQIPAGIPYTVIAVAGESAPSGFGPFDDGKAYGVTVGQGATTTVPLVLSPIPSGAIMTTFTDNVTGVLWDTRFGAGPFASTEHAIYTSNAPTVNPFTLEVDVPNTVVNSLSVGEIFHSIRGGISPMLWLNTGNGILPYQPAVSVPPGILRSDYTTGNGLVNEFKSGSMTDPLQQINRIPLYIRATGLGGAVSTGGQPPTAWFDVDFSQYQGGTRVYDMALTKSYAYVATSTGAYRIPTTAITAGATAQSVISASAPFATGGANSRITSVLAVDDAAGGTGTYLYMGTRSGIYVAHLEDTPAAVFTASPALIPNTERMSPRMMAGISLYDSVTFPGVPRYVILVAAFSPTGVEIIYQDLTNATFGTIAQLPFYAGLPSDIPSDLHQVAWYTYTGYAYVLIGGTKGLAYYTALFYNNP
jgi:hypothetical protein